MPSKIGRSCLTPLISVFGGVAGDATVTRISDDEFWVVSSGISERYQNIGELDWEDRANHLIVEYQRWINGRARPHAVRAVAALDAGEPIERAPPTGRVSLAVALCAIASESEAFREYFTEVYDRTRERRKKGESRFSCL